jgi:hypothetical protein
MEYFYPCFLRNSKINLIRRDAFFGVRQNNNYFFRGTLFFGGSAFVLTGLSGFRIKSSSLFIKFAKIPFLPQGLIMCFYGILGILLSLYLSWRIFWAVGRGFHEYNKRTKRIYIFRWGFPGKNRRVKFCLDFSEIDTLYIQIRSRFINPVRRSLYLKLKNQRNLTLNTSENFSLQEVEYFAATLTKFLNVPLSRD